MKLIQYTTHPERADENEQLIRAVFAELSRTDVADTRYAVLRLADGSFAHLVDAGAGGGPLVKLDAFRAFQAQLKGRVLAPPLVREAVLVGNHRMLCEAE